MEQARGIEPPSHAWQARILTVVLRLQYYYFIKALLPCQIVF